MTSLLQIRDSLKSGINAANGFDVVWISLYNGLPLHRKKEVDTVGLRRLIADVCNDNGKMTVAELNGRITLVSRAQANARAEIRFNGTPVSGRSTVLKLRSH